MDDDRISKTAKRITDQFEYLLATMESLLATMRQSLCVAITNRRTMKKMGK